MTRKTFVAKLHNIENGILGVKNNPEIQNKMSVFGYTPERMAQGQQLRAAAISRTTTQVNGRAVRKAAVARSEGIVKNKTCKL
ncbi:MAG: hypothetical protein LBR10_05890 [Prevotellaceae bacterium]|jgi:hypothetical protein|nr:hypothetical protein [Prevotellaceae bacterium]